MTTDTRAQTGPVTDSEFLARTTEVVSAFVQNNALPASEIPALIKSVYVSMRSLTQEGASGSGELPKPAVPIKKSVTDNYVICLEDGKKLKMLKRYLRSHYGLTPDEYRARWRLPMDYPMVAPNYAAQRSVFAKKIGLGRSRSKPHRRMRG